MPATWHLAGMRAEAEFRLIWADFGWLKDNETRRCP
jgi:hypothetical protein